MPQTALKRNLKEKKQNDFPFLREYQALFTVDENTIFVFQNTIYTNTPFAELPYDIIAHELRHIQQQAKIGARKWIISYLQSPQFRLEQELDAYRTQLRAVKKTNDRQEYAHILMECAQNISSPMYGNIITYSEALKKLKI